MDIDIAGTKVHASSGHRYEVQHGGYRHHPRSPCNTLPVFITYP